MWPSRRGNLSSGSRRTSRDLQPDKSAVGGESEMYQKEKNTTTLYKQGIQVGMKITRSDQVLLWYVEKGCT